MSELAPDTLKKWTSEVEENHTLSLAATVAANAGVVETFRKRENKIDYTVDVYNVEVEPKGKPITDQKSSGRCWLFATTNVWRVTVMRKYNLDKFRLSPSYLFFYDKLEKANFFLDQIVKTAKEDVDSRLVQHLLTDPVGDGGQFSMLSNVVAKYGIVPNHVFPDDFNTLQSNELNRQVTCLLRQYAQELREAIAAGKDHKPLLQKQIQRIHQLLVVFLGKPPGPNDEFTWDYVDKDEKAHSLKSTPLKYLKEVVEFDPKESVSLLNDPRNEYNRVIHVERLGNIVGAPETHYLNVDIDVLAKKAIESLKANKPVFFGTDSSVYHNSDSGIIDNHLWDYEKIGFNPTQSKADRLRYHESVMTHAMVFQGVHLDEDGEPVRWKVENSWGKENGQKGYYCMSHDFFKEYVFQVVVQQNEIPELVKYLDTKPIVLPPWDPCGALAH